MKKIFFIAICILVTGCEIFKSADNYLQQGKKDYEQKYFKRAIDNFNKAIKIDPKLGEAYAMRGFAESDTGDFVGAIRDFEKAIALNFKRKDVFYKAGVDKIIREDFKGAVALLTDAIKIYPNYADAYSERSRAKYLLKDFIGSLNDINKCISLEPTDMRDAIFARGITKIALKDTLKGCDDLYKIQKMKYDPEIDTVIATFCTIKK